MFSASNLRSFTSIVLFAFTFTLATAPFALAEQKQGYQATTTADINIDVVDLEFALLPLSEPELAQEVNAWTKVLKAKAHIVSEAEILANRKQKIINGALEIEALSQESSLLAQKALTDESAAKQLAEELAEILDIAYAIVPADKQDEVKGIIKDDEKSLNALADKAKQYSEKTERRRNLLIKHLAYLKEEQRILLMRYYIVLDSWDAKGGDSKAQRLYADALSGLKVDLADTNAIWLALKAWLSSKEGGLRWLANIVKFMVAITFVYFLSMGLGRLTDKALENKKGISILLKSFIKVAVRRVTLTIGFIVSLTLIEINVAPVLALIGAAGLVVGLALQGTLSNFASGMLILIYRPFDVGDVIEIDGVVGTVDSMTLLSTSIKTFDNQHLVIPNNNVWGTTIINVTGSRTRRVDLVFGIGYADDMDKAQRIMEEVLAKNPMVLKTPEALIKVHELADSSVNFICRPWVKTDDYWDVYWDVTREVKAQFDKQGVSIPFPQRDVHLHQVPPAVT